MNPIYKINGKERRELKKKLSLMKYSHKMFWFFEDVDRVYGGGVDDNCANQYLKKLKEDIDEIELKLSVKIDREKKLERILK